MGLEVPMRTLFTNGGAFQVELKARPKQAHEHVLILTGVLKLVDYNETTRRKPIGKRRVGIHDVVVSFSCVKCMGL